MLVYFAGFILTCGGWSPVCGQYVDLVELFAAFPCNLRFVDKRLSSYSSCGGVIDGVPYVYGRESSKYRVGFLKTFQREVVYPDGRRLFMAVSMGDKLWIFNHVFMTLFYPDGSYLTRSNLPMVAAGYAIINVGNGMLCLVGGSGTANKAHGDTWFINSVTLELKEVLI